MIRLFVYLILTGATWYLSGLYRSFPLTLLFLAEILFLSLLAVQTMIFRVSVSAAFASKILYAEKNRECRCRIQLRQKSVFPAGRVRLTLVLSYPDGRRKFARNLYGAVGPRGEVDLEFFVRPALCGPVTVELRRWRVYDSLSLFSAARRSRESMIIAVLPRPVSMRIQDMTSGGTDAGFSGGANAVTRPESSADFRDSREYRPGDPARAINWKQSARTGNLYVREYEYETDEFFTLILNRSGHFSMENQDAFYEILSAIVSGLLERAAAVRVFWRDGEQSRFVNITGEDSRRELFYQLYLSKPDMISRSRAISGAFPGVIPGAFRFDADLNWRRDQVLIHSFSRADYPSEIAGRVFYI